VSPNLAFSISRGPHIVVDFHRPIGRATIISITNSLEEALRTKQQKCFFIGQAQQFHAISGSFQESGSSMPKKKFMVNLRYPATKKLSWFSR